MHLKKQSTDPRMVTGWAADSLALPIPTYEEIARFNPEAGFPVSGDRLSRFTRAQLAETPAPEVANVKATGRRSSGSAGYMERWAERHRIAQERVERHRLATGHGRHRLETDAAA